MSELHSIISLFDPFDLFIRFVSFFAVAKQNDSSLVLNFNSLFRAICRYGVTFSVERE